MLILKKYVKKWKQPLLNQNVLLQTVESGICFMKLNKKRKWLPSRFLWRITLVNFLVITIAIIVSGWAIYHTACFLVDGMGNFTGAGQEQFNATLFQYLI